MQIKETIKAISKKEYPLTNMLHLWQQSPWNKFRANTSSPLKWTETFNQSSSEDFRYELGN